MSYCIAIHSDIETLIKLKDKIINLGFKPFTVDDADNDEFRKLNREGKILCSIHMYPDKEFQFCNFTDDCNELITTTPSTLHSTIDLVIKKLKEHENNNG
jgi:hypothetical protein